jgi:hypothetical protein
MTRAWIALFFASVWVQKRIRFVPSHVLAAAEPERASPSAAVTRT